jgi:hypothetical protein
MCLSEYLKRIYFIYNVAIQAFFFHAACGGGMGE